jgi:hypothetical protein
MQLSFEYTPEDFKELAKVGQLNAPGQSKRTRRGLFGWLLFIVLGLLLVYLVNLRKAPPVAAPTATPSNVDWRSVVLDALPWLIMFGFVAFIFIRLRFPSAAMIRKRLGEHLLTSMVIDEAGVRSAAGPAETFWKWEAFDKFVETEKVFCLRLTNATTYVNIPKRAASDPATAGELRSILESRIQPPTGAFPVIPL